MGTVTRYVPTFIDYKGMRKLMRSAQGRDTFATAAEAQAWLDAVTAPGTNSPDTLLSVFGTHPRFEVRACECWAGHFDPVGVFFDDLYLYRIDGATVTVAARSRDEADAIIAERNPGKQATFMEVFV